MRSCSFQINMLTSHYHQEKKLLKTLSTFYCSANSVNAARSLMIVRDFSRSHGPSRFWTSIACSLPQNNFGFENYLNYPPDILSYSYCRNYYKILQNWEILKSALLLAVMIYSASIFLKSRPNEHLWCNNDNNSSTYKKIANKVSGTLFKKNLVFLNTEYA